MPPAPDTDPPSSSNYYSGEATNKCSGCPWFCWLPFRSAESGILVMENVKKRGYVMFDKMRILPLDHFLLTMTNIAHFHGRWLAYRSLLHAPCSMLSLKCCN